MGSRCPPGVDRLVFGLIGRRCFGGRGERSSPLSPHRNVLSKRSGVTVGLFSDSAPTHLRCAGVPLGLFGKPKRSSFSRVRGLHQAILWPLLQNARPPGSLRSPSDAAPKCFFKTSRCSGRLIFHKEYTVLFAPKRSTSRFAPLTLRCRTEMFFQNILVFRSAYFPIPHRPTFGAPVFRSAYSASRNARASAAFAASIKPYYGLCSKTLDLQVRSAHPPMPHRNVFSKHSGVPLGLFGKPKRSSSSRFAAFGGRGELRSPLHPPLPPPGCAARVLWTSGERVPQDGRQIKRNARIFPAFLFLYAVVRSADRTGFPDARRSGGAGGRRRQRARRSRRRRG